MSTKKYTHCLPFENGLAWTKYGDYYSRINKEGKVVKSTKFTNIKSDIKGYFKVKKSGKWGLINEKYEFIIPCEHAILNFREGAYYSKHDGEEKLEVDLSE